MSSKMNRPSRRCHTTRQLPPGTERCGYSGEQVSNVAQSSLAAPRLKAVLLVCTISPHWDPCPHFSRISLPPPYRERKRERDREREKERRRERES
ncbi:hypothetical protein J6590_048078 [Homalodisca vitripennis]|nr:hypothetical protein J6590_048078 [Homalodisca vitripennis]